MSLPNAGVNGREDVASKSPVTPFAIDLLSNWQRTRDKLQNELGRMPDTNELINCEELARKQLTVFRKVLQAKGKRPGAPPPHSLKDTLICSTKETIRGFKPLSPYSPIGILDLLAKLERQDQMILTLRFGLLGEAPMNIAEIGDLLGLDYQAVLQHECQALDILGREKTSPE